MGWWLGIHCLRFRTIAPSASRSIATWYEVTRNTCSHPLPPAFLRFKSTLANAWSICAIVSSGTTPVLGSQPPVPWSVVFQRWGTSKAYIDRRLRCDRPLERPGCTNSLFGTSRRGLRSCSIADETFWGWCDELVGTRSKIFRPGLAEGPSYARRLRGRCPAPTHSWPEGWGEEGTSTS